MNQKTKCILKALIPPILIAICIIVVGVAVIESLMINYAQDLPTDPSVLDNSKWTQTTTYQSNCFTLQPIIFIILLIIMGVVAYYGFIRPCLVKEKEETKV